jgi:hypothetical protein
MNTDLIDTICLNEPREPGFLFTALEYWMIRVSCLTSEDLVSYVNRSTSPSVKIVETATQMTRHTAVSMLT